MRLALLVLLLMPGIAQAATKYVSPSGTETWANCNTSSTPCAVATAMSNAVAGDIVRFLSGDYFPPNAANYFQPIWRPTNSGASGNPITFISDSPLGAIIHDAANQGSLGENRTGFGCYNVDWIVFDGFSVTGDRAVGAVVEHPFVVDSCTNVHVQNFDMTGWAHTHHTNGALIGVYGNVRDSSSVYLHHNNLHDLTNSLTPTEAVVNAAAIYIFEANGIHVYNNTIHDVNNAVAWKTSPQNIFVHHNYVYNVNRSAFFPTIESTNHNTHHVHHNLVRNANKFLDAEEAPAGGGTWSDLWLWNNTLYNDASHPFGLAYVAPSGTANVSGMVLGQTSATQTERNVRFYNNIFQFSTTSRGWEIHDDLTSDAILGSPFDYNVYYISSGTLRYIYNGTNTTSFSTYQSAIGGDGEEANSSTSNPQFLNGSGNLNQINDFQLNPGTSPFLSNGFGGVQRGAFEDGLCIGAVCDAAIPEQKRMAPMIHLRRG